MKDSRWLKVSHLQPDLPPSEDNKAEAPRIGTSIIYHPHSTASVTYYGYVTAVHQGLGPLRVDIECQYSFLAECFCRYRILLWEGTGDTPKEPYCMEAR